MRKQLYELSLSGIEGSWNQIWNSNYTSCSLTRSLFLDGTINKLYSASNPTVRSNYILGAATDGHIAVWSTNHSSSPPSAFHVHQNSVKALDEISLPTADPRKSVHVIVTGGDDNALAFTIVTLDERSPREDLSSSANSPIHSHSEDQKIPRQTLILPRAHAAAVSAVKILPSNSPDPIDRNEGHDTSKYKLRIASAGNDQYLKLWNVIVDVDEPSAHTIDVQRAGRFFTPVTDVSAMEVFGMESTTCSNSTEAKSEGSRRLQLSHHPSVGSALGIFVCGIGMDVLVVR